MSSAWSTDPVDQSVLWLPMEIDWFADATEFQRATADLFAADPVRSSILATVAARTARNQADGSFVPGTRPHWFAAVLHYGTPVGAAMRTHPQPPHPAFVQHMPEAAAACLAQGLLERNEVLPGVNGDLPAGLILMQAMAQREQADVVIAARTRLFELGEVKWPPKAPGRLRRATMADVDTVASWRIAFGRDAEEQAGRPSPTMSATLPDDTTNRLDEYWFWEVDDQLVHMTGVNPPAHGVGRIEPVYTPAEHRGHGYAANAVAHLSQRALDHGVRPCLYTDQANPVSNELYQRIGYVALGDEANLVLTPGSRTS